MLFPKALKCGATVGLVCPSSPVTPEQREKCLAVMDELGFRVKEAGNLNHVHGGFMAGLGAERAAEVNALFADPQVDAILCVRGGDGAGRAVPLLDRELIRRCPKPFIGYSDITAYHLVINRQCGLGTFHGPMCASNLTGGLTDLEKQSLWDCLTLDDCAYTPPEGHPLKVLREGRGRGELTGGNLSLLCASMGTPYEVDTRGRVLFIEDVHESCARLDRMLWQLRNSGKLAACAGLLIGQFTECENRYQPDFTWLDVIREAVDGLDIPVLYGVESGHDTPMLTLPLGADCRIDTADAGITFHMDRVK